MKKSKMSIAVDGPASAGKSTIARELAKRLDITYIDTGAMYRALTYKILKNNIDLDDEINIKELLLTTKINFVDGNIHLDGINVNEEIRNNTISQKVSAIAKLKIVRDYMLEIQRDISYNESVVMDGRDIGTIVLPESNFKFFITASIEERSKRRYLELSAKNKENISLDQIRDEIKERDFKDTTRDIAPLQKAKDAILIDNTNLTKEESLVKIINIIKSGCNVL